MQGVVGIGAYVTIQGLTSDVGARLNGLSGKVVAKGDNGRYVRARQLCINHLVHAYVLTEACAPLQKESIDAAHVQ
jgi:hypothetical protein